MVDKNQNLCSLSLQGRIVMFLLTVLGWLQQRFHLELKESSSLPRVKAFLQWKAKTKHNLWANFQVIWSLSRTLSLQTLTCETPYQPKRKINSMQRWILYNCCTRTKFLFFCEGIFIFSCTLSSLLWKTFKRNTLFIDQRNNRLKGSKFDNVKTRKNILIEWQNDIPHTNAYCRASPLRLFSQRCFQLLDSLWQRDVSISSQDLFMVSSLRSSNSWSWHLDVDPADFHSLCNVWNGTISCR